MSLETQTIPAGSIVKIGGLPFQVKSDTQIEGAPGNFKLAKEWNEQNPVCSGESSTCCNSQA